MEELSLLSDEVISSEKKRLSCEKCRRPQRVCWCAYLPEKPIKIRGKVIVLQHPGEEKRNLKTAPMLLNGLESGCCVIYHGKKFPTRKHEGLAELLSEPNTFVLFPGVKSRCLKQVVQSYSAGEQYNLVLIDGTWSQAKSIYFHSPFLHDLPQVSLPEPGPSLYVVRTQPSEHCVSTVESAAMAISIMENDKEIVNQLVNPLRALCTFQLKHGAVEHQDKVTMLELGQYKKKIGKQTIRFLRQIHTCSLANESK